MTRFAILACLALAALPGPVAAESCGPVFADTSAAVDFRRTIGAYYDCDRISHIRALTAAEAAACSHLYEQTKTYFSPEGDGTRFLAFKCWERANPDLVAAFRSLVVAGR